MKVWEELLITAVRMAEQGKRPFSAEDLVVEAWKAFPDTFGLKGHYDSNGRPAYPDSNRVFAETMGSKPLRKKGFIAKVGNKTYDVTTSGKIHAQAIAENTTEDSLSTRKLALSREVAAELARLLESRAFTKSQNATAGNITFHDVCGFWRISSRITAVDLEGRLNSALMTIDAARNSVESGRRDFEHGGKSVSLDQIDALADLHANLLEQFREEIEYIRQRER